MAPPGHDGGGVAISLDVSEIERAVALIEVQLEQRMPQAVKHGADAVAASARETHSYRDRTGRLTRSIAAHAPSGSFLGRTLAAEVIADAPYSLFVERGTRPHKIVARRAKALAWPSGGGMRFAKSVNHPGTKPYNFLSGALERELDDVQAHLQDAMIDAVEAAGIEVQF